MAVSAPTKDCKTQTKQRHHSIDIMPLPIKSSHLQVGLHGGLKVPLVEQLVALLPLVHRPFQALSGVHPADQLRHLTKTSVAVCLCQVPSITVKEREARKTVRTKARISSCFQGTASLLKAKTKALNRLLLMVKLTWGQVGHLWSCA